MVDLYNDTTNFACNIRLLAECLVERQNTKLILDRENDKVHSTNVRFTSGILQQRNSIS
jgi:hypothetical protein